MSETGLSFSSEPISELPRSSRFPLKIRLSGGDEVVVRVREGEDDEIDVDDEDENETIGDDEARLSDLLSVLDWLFKNFASFLSW